MNFLQKIQNLPESKRKLILWIVIIIIGLSLFLFRVPYFQKKIKSLNIEQAKKSFNFPSFKINEGSK